MKIRYDFVTNSSSSSFVVAYKNIDQLIDKETLDKYPFLKLYDKMLNTFLSHTVKYGNTSESKFVHTREELDEYIINTYGFYNEDTVNKILEYDRYLTNEYNKITEYLQGGYKIMFKDIDYCDNKNRELIRFLKDNGILTILECD